MAFTDKLLSEGKIWNPKPKYREPKQDHCMSVDDVSTNLKTSAELLTSPLEPEPISKIEGMVPTKRALKKKQDFCFMRCLLPIPKKWSTIKQ